MKLILKILFITLFFVNNLSADFVYVSNVNANDVTVIDTTTNTVVATVIIAPVPTGVAATPDGAFVYVGCASNNSVNVIDTTTNTVTAMIPIPMSGVPTGITIAEKTVLCLFCDRRRPSWQYA